MTARGHGRDLCARYRDDEDSGSPDRSAADDSGEREQAALDRFGKDAGDGQ